MSSTQMAGLGPRPESRDRAHQVRLRAGHQHFRVGLTFFPPRYRAEQNTFFPRSTANVYVLVLHSSYGVAADQR